MSHSGFDSTLHFYRAHDFDRFVTEAMEYAKDGHPDAGRLVVISLLRLGDQNIAGNTRELLASAAAHAGPWDTLLARYITGEVPFSQISGQANAPHRQCQLLYYEGVKQLIDGNLQECYDTFRASIGTDVDCLERSLAFSEIDALTKSPQFQSAKGRKRPASGRPLGKLTPVDKEKALEIFVNEFLVAFSPRDKTWFSRDGRSQGRVYYEFQDLTVRCLTQEVTDADAAFETSAKVLVQCAIARSRACDAGVWSEWADFNLASNERSHLLMTMLLVKRDGVWKCASSDCNGCVAVTRSELSIAGPAAREIPVEEKRAELMKMASLALKRGSSQPWPSDRIGRDGHFLVFERGAMLPRRCIFCNEPAAGRSIRQGLVTSAWQNPHGIIGALVHFTTRRSTHVHYFLCHKHRLRRIRFAIIAAFLVVAGIGVLTYAGVEHQDNPHLFIGGMASLVVGALVLMLFLRYQLQPVKIEGDLVATVGAGKLFLNSITSSSPL